jgi:hypothetical protein
MKKDKKATIGPARLALLKALCRATRTLAIYDPVQVAEVTGPKGGCMGIRAEYRNGKGETAVDYIVRADILSLRYYGS